MFLPRIGGAASARRSTNDSRMWLPETRARSSPRRPPTRSRQMGRGCPEWSGVGVRATTSASSIQRRLRLEGIAPRLAELAAAAAPYHRDYTLVGWSGLAPEEHLAGLAALSATITVEAPAGDLVLEEGSSDPEAYRQREQAQVAQGRTRHTTVALDAAGEVVAHSDLIFLSTPRCWPIDGGRWFGPPIAVIGSGSRSRRRICNG